MLDSEQFFDSFSETCLPNLNNLATSECALIATWRWIPYSKWTEIRVQICVQWTVFLMIPIIFHLFNMVHMNLPKNLYFLGSLIFARNVLLQIETLFSYLVLDSADTVSIFWTQRTTFAIYFRFAIYLDAF